MFRSLFLASLVAILAACASNPEPMRTGIAPNSRYQPPETAEPVRNANNPAMVGDAAWQAEAAKWIGSPYRRGGASREGMDASGLIRRMYENVARLRLTKDLQELSRTGIAVQRDQLRPGDLLFFGQSQIENAAIFLGENRIVIAMPGVGVAYARLNDPPFSDTYRIARRILR